MMEEPLTPHTGQVCLRPFTKTTDVAACQLRDYLNVICLRQWREICNVRGWIAINNLSALIAHPSRLFYLVPRFYVNCALFKIGDKIEF